jgi:hypothetical protein
LAGHFPRAIKLKNDPGASRSIHHTSRLLLVGKRATKQIIEQERAQRFDGDLSQRR